MFVAFPINIYLSLLFALDMSRYSQIIPKHLNLHHTILLTTQKEVFDVGRLLKCD